MTPLMLAGLLMLSQKTEVPKPQKIVFDTDELIVGTLKSPDGEVVLSYPRPVFGSLIKVRKNFDDKIVRSVEQM